MRSKNTVIDFFRDHKRGLIIATVAVVSGWMIFKGLMQIPGIEQNRIETAKINEQIIQEQNRQKEIDDLAENVNTDEYIAHIASEKLGLVKSNATVFYDISDED